jgi:hypothetical protein
VITATEYVLFPAVGALPAIATETPACYVEEDSYLPIYGFAPPQVGEDDPVPGIPGRFPQPREYDEGSFSLKLVIVGEYDDNGVAQPNALLGVRANLDHFRTNLLMPPGTADGTRPMEFHKLDGSVVGADVFVESAADPGPDSPTSVRWPIRIIVPAGILTP